LVFRDNFRNLVDETRLEFRNVHETIRLGAKVNKAAVVLDALHLASERRTNDNLVFLNGDVLAREAATSLLLVVGVSRRGFRF